MTVTKILGIDFETANECRSSACSVGLCVIDCLSGNVLQKKHLFIKPVPEYFDEFNIMIHGITPDMVKDAPDFSGILPEIAALIDDETIVVAHNSAFDMGVLRSACEWFSLQLPNMNLVCTRVLSRVLLPGLASYSLTDVADACGLGEFEHHAADADAEVCVRILLHFLRNSGAADLEDMLKQSFVRLGTVKNGEYVSCRRKKNASYRSHREDLDALAESIDLSDCEDNPFLGMTCVFTGKLQSMVRAEAEKLVIKRGGQIGDRINADTNFLICGYQDPRVLKGKAKSKKLLSAEKLAAKGQDIQILNEDEFVKML